MERVLVTGANGFTGRVTCRAFIAAGFAVRGAIRSSNHLPEGIEAIQIGDISQCPDWSKAVKDVDIIVHTAARAHKMRDDAADPLSEFRRVNVDGTRYLAEAAASRGVRRFIFISSVKVNGEERIEPYSEIDPPMPEDPYAISKWEAEQVLMQIARQMGMEVVVLRPPLVYGPGVRANFLRLLRLVHRGIPLPLGSVKNVRSLVYVLNLADAIVTCASHPRAAGQVYFVSDGEDISTPELIRRMASVLGRSPRLLPFPVAILQAAGRVTGRLAEINRLTGSLSVCIDKIRRGLSWTPPYSLEDGLAATAEWYRSLFASQGAVSARNV